MPPLSETLSEPRRESGSWKHNSCSSSATTHQTTTRLSRGSASSSIATCREKAAPHTRQSPDPHRVIKAPRYYLLCSASNGLCCSAPDPGKNVSQTALTPSAAVASASMFSTPSTLLGSAERPRQCVKTSIGFSVHPSAPNFANAVSPLVSCTSYHPSRVGV